MNPYRDVNLANWQDRVPAHLSPGGYDIDRLLADPQAQSGVVAHDAPDLGDVSGLRAVHLQCHIGTDTLSLARLGAVVTGVDFSPAALDAARDLFARAGADGRFVLSELYDAPAALAGETFDLVYTGVGALNWLPDIAAWARVVAALLAPGGRLYLREGHPLLFTLDETRDDDLLVVTYPYFQTVAPLRWDDPATYGHPTAQLEHTVTYEWNHGLGETVSAVIDAGLIVDRLVEHRELEWQMFQRTTQDDAGRWILPGQPRSGANDVHARGAQAGMTVSVRTLVLVPSPLVAADTWNPVAEALRRGGHDAIVAPLADAGIGPWWSRHARSAAAAAGSGPVVLVGHSGAGPLLPAIADLVAAPVAAFFVDAGLPRDGASRLDLIADELPPAAQELRSLLAAGGRYPSWTDADLAAEIPERAVRAAILAGLRPRGRDFFSEPLPVPPGWAQVRCGYVRLSAAYDVPARQAAAAAWPVVTLDVGHFGLVTAARVVAGALLDIADQLAL